MKKNDIKDITDQLETQEWLSPIAETTQNAIGAAFEAGGAPGQKIKNFLHGTWLGHALHPVLTDIPIGAWTVAVACDVIDAARGKDDLSRAADTAVGIGLCGAVGAAATGIADYEASGEKAPNSGLVHGALNGTATALFIASLLLRKNGSRSAGRATALLGYGIMSASAYLGGELVYGQRLGVDHAQREELPGDWIAVLPEAELPQHEAKRVDADGIRVLLVRRGEEIFAIGEVCSHLGGPLAEGKLNCDDSECSITCPWHGSRFHLQTGGVLDGPATYVQPKFETRVRDGKIEIKTARGKSADS